MSVFKLLCLFETWFHTQKNGLTINRHLKMFSLKNVCTQDE